MAFFWKSPCELSWHSYLVTKLCAPHLFSLSLSLSLTFSYFIHPLNLILYSRSLFDVKNHKSAKVWHIKAFIVWYYRGELSLCLSFPLNMVLSSKVKHMAIKMLSLLFKLGWFSKNVNLHRKFNFIKALFLRDLIALFIFLNYPDCISLHPVQITPVGAEFLDAVPKAGGHLPSLLLIQIQRGWYSTYLF